MYATKTVSSQTTSAWIPMDDNQAAFNASVAVTVSGTLTYSVEFTLDNVQDPTITPAAFLTTLTGATTSQSLAVHYPVKAFRLNVTAFTSGSAIITVLQGSSWDGAATVGNSLLSELAAIYRPAPFPGFTPRLVASLVTSSTAACTSGVVTVAATAHGVPATYADGFEIYYPGSPTLAAGWYSGMIRTGADSLTFLAPSSPDFASESINGGAAFSSEVTLYSLNMPGNTLNPGDMVSCRVTSSGPGAGTKTITLKYATVILGRNTLTANRLTSDIGFAVSGVAKQSGNTGTIGTAGTLFNGTVDMTVSQEMTITGSSASAGGVLIIHAAKVSVI